MNHSEIINDDVKAYLRGIGAKGGRKSRRRLEPDQARRMVAVREARKAFREYKTSCFWSFDPQWVIHEKDIPTVIRTLRNEGDVKAYALAKRLYRLHSGDGS